MTGTNDNGCAVGGDDARHAHTAIIRELNDKARAAMAFTFVYMTVGVRALGEKSASAVLAEVRRYDAFDPANDPYGEHDFGSMTFAGQRMFWKIDYYDRELRAGSPNPADKRVTARVLTIMLASEY